MTTTPTEAARVRSRVDHPIIDADGHFVELAPLLHEEVITYVEDAGGAALRERFLNVAATFDTSSSLAHRGDATVRDQWKAMPSWWGWQTAAVRDRATSHLPRAALRAPRRARHRLHDPLPVDGARVLRGDRRGAVLGRVPRGEPLSRAPVRAVPRPLHRGRADPDEHTRAGGRRGRIRGARARRQVGAHGRVRSARRSEPAVTASTCSASTANTTTTRSGPSASSSASRRSCTARSSSTASRGRSRTTCTTTSNGLAAAHESLCKSLFLGGRHHAVPGAAHRLPRGRRGLGLQPLRRARRPLGEAQPRSDPRARPRPAGRRHADGVLRGLRRRRGASAASTSSARVLQPAGGATGADRRVLRASASRPTTTSATCFVPNFYFGCEADDPLVAWAFADKSTRWARGCGR